MMKKFIKTVLIYFLLLAAAILALNAAYMIVRPEPNTKKFRNVAQEIQICNFGSSHGYYGFNYEDVADKTCFNFALTSQSLSYDSRILQNYIGCLTHGGTAFITMSFFSTFGEIEEEQDFFPSLNRRYYNFLPKEFIKQYDWREKLYECYLPVLTLDYKLFEVFFSQTEDNNWSGKVEMSLLPESAMSAYERHVKSKYASNGERIINQEEIDAVYEMIDLCRERGVEPILVTTPYLSEYTETIRANDPDFFSDFYGVIEEIQEKTRVRYFDYSTDERFCYDYTLFFDVDHLNKDGARKFTDALLAETIGYRTW